MHVCVCVHLLSHKLGECITLWGDSNELSIQHRVNIFMQYATGLKKTRFPCTLKLFRNTKFNYLKYYNSGREADAWMKFAMILAIYNLSIHKLLGE